MTPIRIALAQINSTVGDLRGNADRIVEFARQAKERGADIVAFPELALLGYPPEDLLFKRRFLADSWALLEEIAREAAAGATLIVGAAEFADGEPLHPGAAPYPGDSQGRVHNAAAILHDRRVAAVYRKMMLPNYGVFDEERYFAPGEERPVHEINGAQIGVNVCEDIWRDPGPAAVQRLAGAQIIVNVNASPYHRGRGEERRELLARRALEHRCFIAYVNMTGGQDELVFDGQSVAFDPDGQLIARAPQFEEALLLLDVDPEAAGAPDADALRAKPGLDALGPSRRVFLSAAPANAPPRDPIAPSVAPELDALAEVRQALVVGTRDYVRKSGFSRAVVGLSGGVDSALTLAVAAEALGQANVTAYFMPSHYTSGQSGDDARALAANLGVRLAVIPIRPLFDAYADALAGEFAGTAPGVAEENLQARVRGNLLMAASNKFGWIVLTTGNKSEMATGYATLYGDMAGGFAVIKDVPKTLVFQLARHINETAGREVIPNAIIVRPPTAELRPDQKDEDSLPPYDVLDPILEAYVENDRSREQMVADGMPADAVDLAISLVDRSEYKRRQAPPGVKITRRNFGRDRRLPIVNRYREGR